jgi:formylglycine-generating enzyme required for sulfatase activity
MPTSTALPEQFGRYRILRKLGEGGMGAVYLAEDGQLGRRVAVKVPHFTAADGPDVIERFYREARVAAAIEHPNLCMVLDVGQIDGIHYLTMPFIDGTPLGRLLDRNDPWPPARAALLVCRLATALHVVHQQGIMHRDLKPANILVRAGDDPVIMDFGLARSVTHSDRLTRTGDMVGTPAYMSSEQIVGDPKAIGSATDIYSLGVILYELATGQLPFAGPGPALFGQILHGQVQVPSALRPGLTGAFDAICCKALARQAKDRYATMAEFAAALQHYLSVRQPGNAAPPVVVVPTAALSPPGPAAPAVIRLVCPKCGKKLRVPPEAPDKSVRCPGCHTRVRTIREATAGTATPRPLPGGATLKPTLLEPQGNDGLAAGRQASRRSLGVLLGAGMVALLVGLLVLVVVLSSRPSRTGREPTSVAVVTTGERPPWPTTVAAVKPLPTIVVPPWPTTRATVAKPPSIVVVPRKPDPSSGQDFANTIGMQMKWIRSGTFQMGSDKALDSDAESSEAPRHSVTIARPFFMAVHVTSQAQFEQILGRQPSWFSASGGGKDKVSGMDTARFPVETVTYSDAVEFCNKLSEKESRRPCYHLTNIQRDADNSLKSAEVELLTNGTGYRLPSEAEWEYCARAEKTTRYWFGDEAAQLGAHAWVFENSGSRTHPVGEKPANPWGLYDMGGLVYQWCDDVWHGNYEGAPSDGSAWRTGGEPARHVVRGGSWGGDARDCRCAYRDRSGAGVRRDNLGFRVVLPSP